MFHTSTIRFRRREPSVPRRLAGGLQLDAGAPVHRQHLAPQHFEHDADGSIKLAIYQAANDALLSNVGLRRHIITANFIYATPHIASDTGATRVLARNPQRLAGLGRAHGRLRLAV